MLNKIVTFSRIDTLQKAELFPHVDLICYTLKLIPRSNRFMEGNNPMGKQHAPGFLKLVQEAKQRVRECSVADVQQRLSQAEPFYLVDVREESEWQGGHLPHAIHLGKGILERDIEKTIPDMHAQIVLYCGGGYRSALAADNLQRMGYTQVISMDGGFSGWQAAGFPVVLPHNKPSRS